MVLHSTVLGHVETAVKVFLAFWVLALLFLVACAIPPRRMPVESSICVTAPADGGLYRTACGPIAEEARLDMAASQ